MTITDMVDEDKSFSKTTVEAAEVRYSPNQWQSHATSIIAGLKSFTLFVI